MNPANTPAMNWPLFHEFPALHAALAPVRLACLPTPVTALPAFGENAWIKRDDITHPLYGGNKIRKLEFVLADMRRRQARHLFMPGATGTNAGIATGMICRDEGIACTIIGFPQPDSATVQNNRRWLQHFGVTFEPHASLWSAMLRYYLHPARLQKHNYFLFAGCSSPVSTFGHVNAAFELREQIRAGQCPCPAKSLSPQAVPRHWPA